MTANNGPARCRWANTKNQLYIDKVRQYDDEKKSKLMQNAGIIRNRLKINAAVNNASVFKAIQEEFGSFADYIWGFTGGKVIYECDRISSPLSDRISEDLMKRDVLSIRRNRNEKTGQRNAQRICVRDNR